MSWLESIRRIYSLDTLDTRFTIPSTTPPRDAEIEKQTDLPKSKSSTTSASNSKATDHLEKAPLPNSQPSLWWTPEFILYYLICAIAIPLMIKTANDVSRESHPSYPRYSHLLSDGWIMGRKVDNSDGQYSTFRDNLPYIAIVLVLHPIVRKAYDSFWRSSSYTEIKRYSGRSNGVSHGLTSNAAADIRMEQRLTFDYWFALVFIAALHGFSSLKILLIMYINYKLAKEAPKQYLPLLTWTFNIGILFANEICRGYSYARILGSFLSSTAGETGLASLGPWLDDHGGLISRWEVLFNLTVLRLISFNLDYYWSLNMRGVNAVEKRQLDPSNLSERDRVSTPAKSEDYAFRNYVAYALYSPLYLAGPIITFNDYISQNRYQVPTVTTDRTKRYAIRFLVCLLTMEVVLHYIYVVAIFNAKPDWSLYTPFQLSMLGYFNLHIIWLKLLIPWRFFRLWSLVDGIDPPENMTRCMSNNYSALAFWRGWHRSYNRWIVRYIYIPLGGSTSKGLWGTSRSIFNFFVVFTFVALWHDINLRLLMWGWLITLFVLPEILGRLAFPAKSWRDRPTAYRVLCGAGAVGNVLMMMIANLVGFAIGVDGLKGLLHGIIGSTSGLVFLAVASGTLFVGVQLMFEVREQEKREGISMKC